MEKWLSGLGIALFSLTTSTHSLENKPCPRLYEIAGGPGVGKTSIIKELQELGEYVIEEAATDYIFMKFDEGILEPWKETGFLWNILLMQLGREDAALEKHASQDVRIFADWGLLDHYAYLEVRGLTQTQEYKDIDRLLKSIDMNERYGATFYVMPFDEFRFESKQTQVRHEQTDEALLVCELTKKAYESVVDRFIIVPSNLSSSERALFILNKVKEIESIPSERLIPDEHLL